MTYLNCSRCGLSIPESRCPTVTPEHCPRCLAWRRRAIPLFRSPLTMRQLACGDDSSSVAGSAPEGE